MIALLALIAVIFVVGGGIEVLRRARLGGRSSVAHHRALDRLGTITGQSADARTDLAPAAESSSLAHVRRAVESDPAQPRIDPQPVSSPVAVPAITGGPNFVGTIPAGEVPGRGPDTEIEGVRLLLPDPAPVDDDGPLDAEGDLGAYADEDGGDVGPEVEPEVEPEVDPEGEAEGEEWDDEGWYEEEDPVAPALDEHEVAASDILPVRVDPEPASTVPADGDDGPVGGHRVVTDTDGDVYWDADAASGLETDEGEEAWSEIAWVLDVVEPSPAVPAEMVSDGFDQAESEDEAEDEAEDDADPLGDQDGDDARADAPVVLRFDDVAGPGEARSTPAPALATAGHAGRSRHRHERPRSGHSTARSPEQARAQLAALAQSGGMEPVAPPRRGRRRATRRSWKPTGEHRHALGSAAMVLVAVVVLGGAIALVTERSNAPKGRHLTAVAATPANTSATTTPPTTAVAKPAALVGQTSSTATYQLTGSPTIALTFNSSCWIQARAGSPTGRVLVEGLQPSGAQRQLTGPVWIRLGNPTAVAVSVGGSAVQEPPVTAGSPFNFQFQ